MDNLTNRAPTPRTTPGIPARCSARRGEDAPWRRGPTVGAQGGRAGKSPNPQQSRRRSSRCCVAVTSYLSVAVNGSHLRARAWPAEHDEAAWQSRHDRCVRVASGARARARALDGEVGEAAWQSRRDRCVLVASGARARARSRVGEVGGAAWQSRHGRCMIVASGARR